LRDIVQIVFEAGSCCCYSEVVLGSITFLLGINSRSLPWMNIMIAIPAAAIPLITPLLRWQDLCFDFCRLLTDDIFFVMALGFCDDISLKTRGAYLRLSAYLATQL
jgi:hypothetical protein